MMKKLKMDYIMACLMHKISSIRKKTQVGDIAMVLQQNISTPRCKIVILLRQTGLPSERAQTRNANDDDNYR